MFDRFPRILNTRNPADLTMPDNLLLLTIDSLRADTIIEEEVDTPAIDSLRTDGIEFDRAFATGPGTSPSFPALLTGTLPLSYDGLGPLSADRPRLSTQFQNAGFATAAFHSNPFLSSHFNYEVGFDQFMDYQNPLMGVATKVFPQGIELNQTPLARVDELVNLTGFIKWTYQKVRGKPRPYVPADVISADTIEWLESVQQAFFCWSHYMDVHQPCYPPAEYREQFDVGDVSQSEAAELYSRSLSTGKLTESELMNHRSLAKAALAFTDEQIGRILTALEKQGKFDDTLIVLTSDHGHLYGEYNTFGKPERMYDELLQVPLILVNYPTRIGDAVENLVSLLDIPPTMHRLFDLPIPQEYEGQAIGHGDPRTHIIAEHEVDEDVIVGVRTEDLLYEYDEINDDERLFEFRNGGLNRTKRTAEDDIVRPVIANRLSEIDVDGYVLEQETDSEIQERLEDLGYL
jgi:arylsulfatase A-like enzyme